MPKKITKSPAKPSVSSSSTTDFNGNLPKTNSVITRHLCLNRDLGVGGNLFGGVMLSWIDEAAGIYAMLVIGSEMIVTRAFEHAEFHHPVRLGDLVEFIADGYKIGRTSITVNLRVVILEVSTGHRIDTHSVAVTMVHVSRSGFPLEIKKVGV